jgi:hypothetical protein
MRSPGRIGYLEFCGFAALARGAAPLNSKQPSCVHTMDFLAPLHFALYGACGAGGDSTGFHCEIRNEHHNL